MADDFKKFGYDEMFGDIGMKVPEATRPGSESNNTTKASSTTGTPEPTYDMGIKGGTDFTEYRLGVIKDAFKNQPTLWEAIGKHRENQMTALENNSAIALLAYIDTHDPNTLSMFMENEKSLAVEREKKISEDWAKDTLRNPGASEVSKQMARGIAAKIFKPYALETDMAQFVQFQAGLASSKLTTAQGQSYLQSDGSAESSLQAMQMKLMESEMQHRYNVLAQAQGKKIPPEMQRLFAKWFPGEYIVEGEDDGIQKQRKSMGVS